MKKQNSAKSNQQSKTKKVKGSLKAVGSKSANQSVSEKSSNKQAGSFTYQNVASKTVSDKKDLENFLTAEGNKRVVERMKKRNIKLSDVERISFYHQKQFLNEKLRSDSFRYLFFLKDKSKKLFNFSKFYKVK